MKHAEIFLLHRGADGQKIPALFASHVVKNRGFAGSL